MSQDAPGTARGTSLGGGVLGGGSSTGESGGGDSYMDVAGSGGEFQVAGAAGVDPSMLLDLMTCGVCLCVVCQPITLCCGHTFCRTCIVRTLRRNKKKCPTCRTVCHNSAEDQPESVMVAHIARACFPELYAERARETEQEKRTWQTLMPIFYYNLPMFPGETLSLHLFEPRYKLMMQRIINTSRKFAYVPNYSNYVATVGDVALVAEVRECEFLSDGRVLLEAKLVGRYRVMDHFVEDGTQNLHYCQLEELRDAEPSSAAEADEVDLLRGRADSLANRVIGPVKAQVLKTHGEMPTSSSGLSLWIASVLPMPIGEKHALLSGTCTLHRLRVCIAKLAAMTGAVTPAGGGGGQVDHNGAPAVTTGGGSGLLSGAT